MLCPTDFVLNKECVFTHIYIPQLSAILSQNRGFSFIVYDFKRKQWYETIFTTFLVALCACNLSLNINRNNNNGPASKSSFVIIISKLFIRIATVFGIDSWTKRQLDIQMAELCWNFIFT